MQNIYGEAVKKKKKKMARGSKNARQSSRREINKYRLCKIRYLRLSYAQIRYRGNTSEDNNNFSIFHIGAVDLFDLAAGIY